MLRHQPFDFRWRGLHVCFSKGTRTVHLYQKCLVEHISYFFLLKMSESCLSWICPLTGKCSMIKSWKSVDIKVVATITEIHVQGQSEHSYKCSLDPSIYVKMESHANSQSQYSVKFVVKSVFCQTLTFWSSKGWTNIPLNYYRYNPIFHETIFIYMLHCS